jgi:predicted acetyltransferase
MKMVFPTLEYKNKAIAFIQEFYEYDSEINGSGSLDNYLK